MCVWALFSAIMAIGQGQCNLIHFEFHQQVETLKESYAPFNPDVDTRIIYSYSDHEKKDCQDKLVEALKL